MKRRRPAPNRPQQVKLGLALFYLLMISLLVWDLLDSRLSSKQLIALSLLLFAVTEWASRILLKRYQPLFGGAQPHPFRMSPHIFTHYLPSPAYADITPEGFRMTGHSHIRRMQGGETRDLYLAGDDTFFEDHLPLNQTLAHFLEKQLKGVRVLNAGTGHYTALHAYNRLVLDRVRGIRPAQVLFSCGLSDALTFIYHKQGRVHSDHTHLYRPWSGPFERYQQISKIPTATLRLGLSYLFFGTGRPEWDSAAQEIAPAFEQLQSLEAAQRLFDPTGFRTCLELFRGTCQTIGAELILGTLATQDRELQSEPGKSCARGIDQLNETTRDFARRHNLTLVDWARTLDPAPEDILHKWHYTESGNRKRAQLALKQLEVNRPSSDRVLHEILQG